MDVKHRNLKGFIFTLDAIFALIVAAAGISIILYISFTGSTQYAAPAFEAHAILQSMLHTSLNSAMSGSQYISYLVVSSNSTAGIWQQFGHGSSLSSGTSHATQSAFLLYSFNSPSLSVLPTAVVNSGFVALSSGNSIELLNATTGNVVGMLSSGSGSVSDVVGVPAIYRNMLYYGNANGIVGAINLQSMSHQWLFYSSSAITTPIEILNNYVSFGTSNGIYLLNTLNGSEVAHASTSLPLGVPLYVQGEYVVPTDSSGQNYLYSYSLNGNTLTLVWNALLSSGSTTAPASVNNTIAVGSGDYVYVLSIGGNIISQSTPLDSPLYGIGGYGANYYAQSAYTLYTLSSLNGNIIFKNGNPQDTANTVPSAGPSSVYTLINGNLFLAYNTSTDQLLWNITLPNGATGTGYSNIALAYGNMYVIGGNSLYVFGTYKQQGDDSMLYTLANMYAGNQGSYADALISSIYNQSNIGIFINNTYAPDLSIATFNSMQDNYVMQSEGFTWMNSPSQPFSISIWVYPTSDNGVIVSRDGNMVPNTGNHHDLIDLVNGNVILDLAGFPGCPVLGSIPTKSWSNIVATYNGSAEKGYIDGKLVFSANGVDTGYSAGISIFYPIGSADSSNCGSGVPYNGSIADYQVYNASLYPQQVSELWEGGAFSAPIIKLHNVLWWPLNGNANDYSGLFNLGIQSENGISYNTLPYTPLSLSNAYQVSKASVPMVLNRNGVNKEYNISVVVWH